MAKRNGLTSLQQGEASMADVYERHKRVVRIVLIVIFVLAVGIAGVVLWTELRTYKDYEVLNSHDAPESNSKMYARFLDKTVEYSNDGVLYRDSDWNLLWNQSFEMDSPQIAICEGYMAIYDKLGTEIYIMNKRGLVKRLDMSKPIYSLAVANQGTVAVMMKDGATTYVKLFDADGKELTNGEFYESQKCYPVAIAISNDAKKLAVDIIDSSKAKLKTVIKFYNFGSVGQNEVNNEVSSETFDEAIFPEIKFVTNDRLIAIGDEQYAVFEGTQKPSLVGSYAYGETVQSLCYNNKYVCITYSNNDSDNTFHIRAMDLKGKTVMDQDTAIPYNTVEFLENNEICIRSKYDCEIFTIHGVKKFAYTFDRELFSVISGNDRQTYAFAIEKTLEEVRLK